ncbi:hypothetical protein ASD37_21855 [Mycobacterium sp. Root135]|nr:hypothetical protein [Mycobacterium sp. Root135]KQY04545.1 hypothetical protein ASD37_21855 [Mycobacterium sp. Root135]
MFSHDGETRAACEAVEHGWEAPPRDAQCQLNWGSRLQLEEGGDAAFACYAQELPAAQEPLGYGSTWSIGTITCSSEQVGITCADSTSGHRFEISRDAYRLG